MAEWLKALLSKSNVSIFDSAGSNPVLSSIIYNIRRMLEIMAESWYENQRFDNEGLVNDEWNEEVNLPELILGANEVSEHVNPSLSGFNTIQQF